MQQKDSDNMLVVWKASIIWYYKHTQYSLWPISLRNHTWEAAALIITFVVAADTSAIVLARNKTAHIILEFTIVTHKILAAVAFIAMHMVDADATILARSWCTLINVHTAHVTCSMWKTRLRDIRVMCTTAALEMNTKGIAGHYQILILKPIN